MDWQDIKKLIREELKEATTVSAGDTKSAIIIIHMITKAINPTMDFSFQSLFSLNIDHISVIFCFIIE